MCTSSKKYPLKNYNFKYMSTYLKVLSIEDIVRRKVMYPYAN